jgi:hypothetical protein
MKYLAMVGLTLTACGGIDTLEYRDAGSFRFQPVVKNIKYEVNIKEVYFTRKTAGVSKVNVHQEIKNRIVDAGVEDVFKGVLQ